MSHGDCPKHGRWYGICHSCAKEMQDREDFIYRESVINERNRLRTELAATKEKLARAEDILKCFESVLCEDDLREVFLCYVQGARALDLIKAYREVGGEW